MEEGLNRFFEKEIAQSIKNTGKLYDAAELRGIQINKFLSF
jgi:hypothetical protein